MEYPCAAVSSTRNARSCAAHWRVKPMALEAMETMQDTHAEYASARPPGEWLPQLVHTAFFEPCPLHARTNSRTEALNYFSIMHCVPQCGRCEVTGGDRLVQVCAVHFPASKHRSAYELLLQNLVTSCGASFAGVHADHSLI